MSDFHQYFAHRVRVPTDLIIQRDRKPRHEIQVPLHDYVDNREVPPEWKRERGGEWQHRDDPKPEMPRGPRDLEW